MCARDDDADTGGAARAGWDAADGGLAEFGRICGSHPSRACLWVVHRYVAVPTDKRCESWEDSESGVIPDWEQG